MIYMTWEGESYRKGLASRGIKTSDNVKKYNKSILENKSEIDIKRKLAEKYKEYGDLFKEPEYNTPLVKDYMYAMTVPRTGDYDVLNAPEPIKKIAKLRSELVDVPENVSDTAFMLSLKPEVRQSVLNIMANQSPEKRREIRHVMADIYINDPLLFDKPFTFDEFDERVENRQKEAYTEWLKRYNKATHFHGKNVISRDSDGNIVVTKGAILATNLGLRPKTSQTMRKKKKLLKDLELEQTKSYHKAEPEEGYFE